MSDCRQVLAPLPQTQLTPPEGLAELVTGVLQGLAMLIWAAVLFAPCVLIWKTGAAGLDLLHDLNASPAVRENLAVTSEILLDTGWTTLLVSALTAGTALLIGIPVGFLLAKTDVPLRRLWWGLLLLLVCTPLYVTTTGWVRLFSLASLTATTVRQIAGAGLIMGVAYSPLAVLLVSIGFWSVPREIEDAALLQYAPHRAWSRVHVPMALWSLVGAALFTAVLAAGEITVADALWTRTYAEQLFQSFQLHWDAARAFLVALPLMIVLLVGVTALAPLLRRFTALPLARMTEHPRVLALGVHRRAAILLLSGVALLYLYPLLDLFYYALVSGRGNIMAFLATWPKLLLTSAGLAALGATLAVCMALPCAWLLRTLRRRWLRLLLWGIVLLLLTMPAPLVGTSMALAWNQPGLLGRIYDSPVIVSLLYATRMSPLAVIFLWCALQQMPATHLDCARLLGLRGISLMTRLVLPTSKRSMAGAWFLCYILSMAEVGGVVVATPPGVPLFSVHFATQIHFGVYPDLARMAFMPLVMAVVPVMAWAWWLQRKSNT